MHPRREYHYTVELDGSLWHAGTQINDPAVLKLYLRGVRSEGTDWVFVCQGERNLVHAHDTPLVVRRVHLHEGGDGLERVELDLGADVVEELDPATLSIGETNVLYARLRDGSIPARLSRRAYMELAGYVELEDQQFVLPVGGKRWVLGRHES